MNAIPPIWTTTSTEANHTGSWRAALPRHLQAASPCHAACPVNGDIATWIGQARAGDYRGAWETLTRHNPFPAVAGRICHHPCERACNRGDQDEAVSICKLERFVGDVAIEQGWSFAAPAEERDERVAVVGGGPAGLSCAYQLRRMGYRVTLVEATRELGGLMRQGIPSYRLSRSLLDAEIARIVALGVEVRLRTRVATPQAWTSLRASHDAVFVATGAQVPKRLPALDYAQPWVMDGAAWLAAANAGAPPVLGRRLLVVGGGSAALDVARSARRAGHAVTLLSLEARAQMPAQREEVEEALEEGVVLVDGARLVEARALGHGVAVGLQRVRFTPGTRRGQFEVTPLPGATFRLETDAIVTSIGQDPDAAALAGTLDADGVWAGGDVVSMERFVTDAIGQGKRAALAIDRALRGRRGDDAQRPAWRPGPAAATAVDTIVPLHAIATHAYPPQPRAAERRLDARVRLATADEVQLPFDVGQALAEATRCFSCGTCIGCDTCVVVCPDLAVVRGTDGYAVLGDYCKGCGLCVKECPTGAMDMIAEAK